MSPRAPDQRPHPARRHQPLVRPHRLEAALRARLAPRPRKVPVLPWLRYYAGRWLQVTGLVVTLVAGTAFFGTSSTTAMLKLMLAGVAIFVPGWLLARRDPRQG